MSSVRSINVNSLDEIIDEINLIDIREEYEYEEKRLKNTKNIPMHTLLDDPEEYLDENQDYYIICETGRRSLITAGMLDEQGYSVINVSGGTSGYEGENIEY